MLYMAAIRLQQGIDNMLIYTAVHSKNLMKQSVSIGSGVSESGDGVPLVMGETPTVTKLSGGKNWVTEINKDMSTVTDKQLSTVVQEHLETTADKHLSTITDSSNVSSSVDVSSFDWLENSIDDSKDVFKSVKDTSKNVGQSGYHFMRTLGIVILLVAIAMAGISLILSHSPRGREESKQRIANILLGGAVIFGVIGLAGISIAIGKGL